MEVTRKMKKALHRSLALLLAIVMVCGLLPTSIPLAHAEESTHKFNATTLPVGENRENMPEGPISGNEFFSVIGTVQKYNKSDNTAVASIELAKAGAGAISFTLTGTAKVVIGASSSSGKNTSAVAVINSANEVMENAEGITPEVGVAGSKPTTLTYTLEAGTYRIVSPASESFDRIARLYTIHVEETAGAQPERAPWDSVALPAVTKIEQKDGNLKVTVDMAIGYNGADSIVVSMLDSEGHVLQSKTITAEGDSREIDFTPATSGTFTFSVIAKRAEEADKASVENESGAFVLPLKVPTVTLIHQGANGALTAIWSETEEATSYEVTLTAPDGTTTVKTTTDRQYTFEGLTVGQTYSITVVAIRDEERSEASAAAEATATAEAQQNWGFTTYGPSTNEANNGYKINEDGIVSVWSEGGKGKVQPGSTDGLSFYYTAIPTTHNFTLRAKVHVNSWKYSNGQEGFGLLAADRLGIHGDTEEFWTNQYMLGLSKIEYYYDFDAEQVTASTGVKFTMKLGLGAYSKIGLTKENLAYAGVTTPKDFVYETRPMEFTAVEKVWEKGNYNIVGNVTNPDSVEGKLADVTDFILEIQKNNTGYFLSYYDTEGKLIHQEKYYGAEDLNKLDSEFVYAGFFASRNANITVSDVNLTTIAKENDKPAEEKPIEKITPEVSITSGDAAQTTDYKLTFVANVAGTASIRVNDKAAEAAELNNISMKAEEKVTVTVPVTANDITKITVVFQPDPDQDLGEGVQLSGTGTVSTEINVTHTTLFESRENLYVSPYGFSTGDGSMRKPLDIYTAVSVVRPGQTIILMEGTYKLEKVLKIPRGVDGTAEKPIRMIADPNAETRPVFDCTNVPAGSSAAIVHGGNYWFFYGFDVTKSVDGAKGFQVSGSNNVLDNIIAHHNGNTGIQISRYSGKDLTIAEWPANNLVRNCTSYANADNGYEDADGFAAKLTIGEGNVFDGCIAYNNADDGWDLYAKVETGAIGAVTIKNCVAYGNGYLEDGTNAGNGNGFKMGGSSITGKHKLINSIAFNNKAKGIDSNSCPDIIVENCISYNNGSHNVAFYTNKKQDTAFVATGIISYKDSNCIDASKAESIKPYGSQNESAIYNDTCYYWDGTACKNASGTSLATDIFKSVEFKGITRNADGTINMQGFLELSDKAPADAGARLNGNGTASENVPVTNPDDAFTADEKAANSVIYKIFDLGVISLDSEDAIVAARAAYNALSDAQKALVTNYETLEKAEQRLAELKPKDDPDSGDSPAPGEPNVPADPTTPAEPTTPDGTTAPTEPGVLVPEPTVDNDKTVVIVVIVVLGVAAIGAGVIYFLREKKKKQ